MTTLTVAACWFTAKRAWKFKVTPKVLPEKFFVLKFFVTQITLNSINLVRLVPMTIQVTLAPVKLSTINTFEGGTA